MTAIEHVSARSTRLDLTAKHEVHYCIPLWLRDEQIKLAIARPGVGRIATDHAMRPDPVAVVGSGPSLHQTWEEIRQFRFIISCSGAHKFLIERRIIPTWHVEVDPRSHKVGLLGPPHREVTYLPASTCHPDYFDHLAGSKVELWHVFSNEEDALRTLPAGEWALMGGPDVGMRALVIARFFGFTDLRVFGMDGCYGRDSTHAGPHPNHNRAKGIPCEYGGRTYDTTPALLECAKAVWHELDQMPDVRARFHGDGLIQAMAQDYVPKPLPKGKVLIGLTKPELISADYVQLNRQLHRENLAYGVGGDRYAQTVLKLTAALKTKNVLDYGCGKGRLGRALPFQIAEYDPAVTGKEESPKPADIVICTDVLEHVEPEKLLYVLGDLRRCIQQVGYFVIHTGPSMKSLADGRNTHLIQQPKAWWEEKLDGLFHVGQIFEAGPLLHCVVGPARKAKTSPDAIANAALEMRRVA